jgi:DNA invertase Pin-like site-specific DNA recombinase
MSKTVFCYVRDSGGPAQERSVPEQRAALQKWADEQGYLIGRWYVDEARSGTNEERPEFQRLIAEAQREKPYAVAVWDLARFARDQDAAQFYRSLLRRAGVAVISLNDNIPDGPLARIVESVIDFSSEHYVATLRANVKRGQRGILALGFIPGAQPPVGYRAAREQFGVRRSGEPRYGVRWVLDEERAPAVREAFTLRSQGVSLRQIMAATRLHRTRQGYNAMFHNPAYKGVYRYGEEEFAGVVPALVEPDLWEAVQRPLRIHPRTAAGDYLLSGLLRCGYCGAAMSGFASSRTLQSGRQWRKRYYICGERNATVAGCRAALVGADDLEAAVLQLAFADFLDPVPFAAFLAAVQAESAVADHTIRQQTLARDITRTERAISDLVELVGQGIAVAEIGRRLRGCEEELRELRRRQAELGALPALLTATPAEAAAFIAALRDRLTTGAVSAQRWVLHQVIASLSYGPQLHIAFKLPTA